MLGEGDSNTFPSPKNAPNPEEKSKSPAVGADDPALASSASQYTDGLGPDRYYLSTSKPSGEVTSPLFPYSQTGSVAGSVYTPPAASRYSTSLHFGSVLPPTGFPSAGCPGRSHLGPAYQFGPAGCLYPSYSGVSGGVPPPSGAGMRAQVYLCNRPLWLKFHRHQTEMIITKQGRRMFPFLSFNMTGLNLSAHYNVFVEVVLADPNHWRFQGGKWVTCGKADNNMQGNKMHVHPESPNTGAHWMRQEISFGKLKLTNNKGASNNAQMIVLQSLHKYQPRLHIVEVREDIMDMSSCEPKTQTFTFPENQFIAVTAYQNTDITQLKIDHNPFAKGFRDNYDSIYTAPEGDRLTPSPTDSSRSHQIVPGARYAMQPFFQNQFANNLTQNRFYNSERAVPQNNGLLSPQPEDSASAWFVSMQQAGAGSSKFELNSYEGDYTNSLIPYSIKSLPLQTPHGLSYYPDSPYSPMATGWGSRGSYQRKVATGLPWSPRPTPNGFPKDQLLVPGKDKAQEDEISSSGGSLTSAWSDHHSSPLSLEKADSGAYRTGCKRRRTSESGLGTESSPSIKCEEDQAAIYMKDSPVNKSVAYCSFYPSP
ncbi:hypothetical protein DPEC_G00052730 [Dallia pectoralis]|uniref:Uncharacterized protein n=1 Tax=Dallia pectoralis TaxID=75939 RepID=A0ACC2HCI1_DALPE|nr:hypothetical protein DPEC_G00052730 [Dallia pectoralis]